MRRRRFLLTTAVAPALLLGTNEKLTHKQRIDRALTGKDVDRPPFTHWHHFGLTTPEEHAAETLRYHRDYRTDLVKVMSDFPYPKPAAERWYELKVEKNPFPQQIRALELIRDGLNGDAYFIETIFNPWNVAEKLSSKEEVLRLKQENPKALMQALEVITESEINHAKLATRTGVSGFLVSVANANAKELSPEDYQKFSAPFDKKFLEATKGAKLNFLHLHWEPAYVDLFQSFPAPVINFSQHVSGVQMGDVRSKYPSAVLAGGIDEVHYRELTPAQLKQQADAARAAAGPKFILTPGCSVPNDSKPEELSRLPQLLGA